MHRRAFHHALLSTLASVTWVDVLMRGRLLAAPAQLPVAQWLRRLHELCRDLRTDRLDTAQWHDQITELHARIGLDDLVALIDLERVSAGFVYPDLGVVTRDPVLPRVAGVPDHHAFIARIFGMSKGRAIIPHGHRHMVSCHRVIGGEFHLRQYDRVTDDGDALLVRPTRDEVARLGHASSISEARDNVHWLIATTPRAFTFDVIVTDLAGATEIDNLDMAAAERVAPDLLRVKKLDVAAALARYGKV
jgi:hypothetical protein